MRVKSGLVCATLAALVMVGGCAQTPVAPAPPPQAAAPAPAPEVANGLVSNAAWGADMDAFAAQDAAHPPQRDAVLFIGSSSIRKWTSLAQAFPETAVINRGFGGSEVRDSTYYADRIVVPYHPRKVVFYAGDNDLAAGRSAQQVADDVAAFVQRVRRDLPAEPIVYVAIKPSPSRASLLPQIRQANALIQAMAAKDPRMTYVDVFTPMLKPDGSLRPELFGPDMLHMNADGYALWTRLLKPSVDATP